MSSPTNPSDQAQGHTQPQPGGDSTRPAPTPKPGPRPGEGPGTRRTTPAHVAGASSRSTTAIVAQPVVSDPSKFGRVDPDGTAWLVTSAGERRVGSYQAGSPEEGLKHFGARYDAVATEVAILEARLHTHPAEAQRIRHDAAKIREGLASAAIIGDVEALDRRLADLDAAAVDVAEKTSRDKEAQRSKAIARKEALAAEAEAIGAESTDWKPAGDRLRAILEEWKSIRGIDKATDDALWKRYSAGRDAFNQRRGAHFSELDKLRAVARVKKEQLVEQAEALQHSTDWAATSAAFRDLMSQWKAAGRAPREADDRLWDRFKAAQDVFHGARKAEQAQRDSEFEDNATAKLALLEEYDSKIDPAGGLDKARAQLRELQDKWEAIGFVPRARIREFDDKLGALEQRVTDAADAEWRRTDPEAQARVAQFKAKVEQLQTEAEAAEAKGASAKAEQLRAQASQWQEWADAAESALDGSAEG